MSDKSLMAILREDLNYHSGGKRKFYAFLFDQRLRMLRWVRIKLAAGRSGVPLVVPLYDILLLRFFSSQVGEKVSIGSRLKFAHPIGIVLGKGSVIGNDCTIYQHVTLGGHSRKSNGISYPVLSDRVTIFSNSVLVGGINIGEGATVGACSMVSKSVEPGTTVGGVPARPLTRKV